MENIDKPDLPSRERTRQFSKKFSKNERAELASQIRDVHQKYLSQKQLLQEDFKNTSAESHESERSIADLREELNLIRSRILEIEHSTVIRLMNAVGFSREKSRLQSQINNLEEGIAEKEKKLSEYTETLDKLTALIDDRAVLDKARDEINEFYITQSIKFKEFVERQEKIRSISDLCEKFDVICVHSVHPFFVPDSNSLLDPLCDWQTKCDIFLSLSPVIAASTLRKGDNKDNMWAQVGFIIKDGHMESIKQGDAGTVAKTINERTGFDDEITENEVRNAVEFRTQFKSQKYNELVISRQSISGFYISFDKKGDRINSVPPHKEIFDYCSKIGMPVFGIFEGQLHELIFDNDKKEYVLTERLIDKDDIPPFVMKDEMSAEMKSRIFEDGPFRIHSRESMLVGSYSSGAQDYIILKYNDILKQDDDGVLIELPGTMGKLVIKVGDSDGERRIYKSTESRFINNKKIIKYSQYVRDIPLEKFSPGVVHVRNFEPFTIGSFRDATGYLECMDKMLSALFLDDPSVFMRKTFPRLNLDNKSLKEIAENLLKNLAFNLYGFGETARKMGDEQISNEAIKLAQEFLPEDEYSAIMTRRVNKHTRIRIFEEDFRG